MSGELTSSNNNTRGWGMKLWINLYGENDGNITNPPAVTCADCSGELQEARLIVLLVIGAVGLLIVGFLLVCMFHKNERILQKIPCTKEYKRRQEEPEYFYPIPQLGAIRMVASQGKSVALLANPKLLDKNLLNAIGSQSGIQIKITDTDETEKNEQATEDNEDAKSDRSSFNESDGMEDESDMAGNTFPAGGSREVRSKKKNKRPGDKRIKRLRKKNVYSTSVVVKESKPGPETADQYNEDDDEIEYMGSRF